ncbi:MAG: hypothetical protein M1817_003339 [Caeruleum heppii]|nr:MAG: hypothetical protein M1817_003339 [Caeruleum heppii]
MCLPAGLLTLVTPCENVDLKGSLNTMDGLICSNFIVLPRTNPVNTECALHGADLRVNMVHTSPLSTTPAPVTPPHINHNPRHSPYHFSPPSHYSSPDAARAIAEGRQMINDYCESLVAARSEHQNQESTSISTSSQDSNESAVEDLGPNNDATYMMSGGLQSPSDTPYINEPWVQPEFVNHLTTSAPCCLNDPNDPTPEADRICYITGSRWVDWAFKAAYEAPQIDVDERYEASGLADAKSGDVVDVDKLFNATGDIAETMTVTAGEQIQGISKEQMHPGPVAPEHLSTTGLQQQTPAESQVPKSSSFRFRADAPAFVPAFASSPPSIPAITVTPPAFNADNNKENELPDSEAPRQDKGKGKTLQIDGVPPTSRSSTRQREVLSTLPAHGTPPKADHSGIVDQESTDAKTIEQHRPAFDVWSEHDEVLHYQRSGSTSATGYQGTSSTAVPREPSSFSLPGTSATWMHHEPRSFTAQQLAWGNAMGWTGPPLEETLAQAKQLAEEEDEEVDEYEDAEPDKKVYGGYGDDKVDGYAPFRKHRPVTGRILGEIIDMVKLQNVQPSSPRPGTPDEEKALVLRRRSVFPTVAYEHKAQETPDSVNLPTVAEETDHDPMPENVRYLSQTADVVDDEDLYGVSEDEEGPQTTDLPPRPCHPTPGRSSRVLYERLAAADGREEAACPASPTPSPRKLEASMSDMNDAVEEQIALKVPMPSREEPLLADDAKLVDSDQELAATNAREELTDTPSETGGNPTNLWGILTSNKKPEQDNFAVFGESDILPTETADDATTEKNPANLWGILSSNGKQDQEQLEATDEYSVLPRAPHGGLAGSIVPEKNPSNLWGILTSNGSPEIETSQLSQVSAAVKMEKPSIQEPKKEAKQDEKEVPEDLSSPQVNAKNVPEANRNCEPQELSGKTPSNLWGILQSSQYQQSRQLSEVDATSTPDNTSTAADPLEGFQDSKESEEALSLRSFPTQTDWSVFDLLDQLEESDLPEEFTVPVSVPARTTKRGAKRKAKKAKQAVKAAQVPARKQATDKTAGTVAEMTKTVNEPQEKEEDCPTQTEVETATNSVSDTVEKSKPSTAQTYRLSTPIVELPFQVDLTTPESLEEIHKEEDSSGTTSKPAGKAPGPINVLTAKLSQGAAKRKAKKAEKSKAKKAEKKKLSIAAKVREGHTLTAAIPRVVSTSSEEGAHGADKDDGPAFDSCSEPPSPKNGMEGAITPPYTNDEDSYEETPPEDLNSEVARQPATSAVEEEEDRDAAEGANEHAVGRSSTELEPNFQEVVSKEFLSGGNSSCQKALSATEVEQDIASRHKQGALEDVQELLQPFEEAQPALLPQEDVAALEVMDESHLTEQIDSDAAKNNATPEAVTARLIDDVVGLPRNSRLSVMTSPSCEDLRSLGHCRSLTRIVSLDRLRYEQLLDPSDDLTIAVNIAQDDPPSSLNIESTSRMGPGISNSPKLSSSEEESLAKESAGEAFSDEVEKPAVGLMDSAIVSMTKPSKVPDISPKDVEFLEELMSKPHIQDQLAEEECGVNGAHIDMPQTADTPNLESVISEGSTVEDSSRPGHDLIADSSEHGPQDQLMESFREQSEDNQSQSAVERSDNDPHYLYDFSSASLIDPMASVASLRLGFSENEAGEVIYPNTSIPAQHTQSCVPVHGNGCSTGQSTPVAPFVHEKLGFGRASAAQNAAVPPSMRVPPDMPEYLATHHGLEYHPMDRCPDSQDNNSTPGTDTVGMGSNGTCGKSVIEQLTESVTKLGETPLPPPQVKADMVAQLDMNPYRIMMANMAEGEALLAESNELSRKFEAFFRKTGFWPGQQQMARDQHNKLHGFQGCHRCMFDKVGEFWGNPCSHAKE